MSKIRYSRDTDVLLVELSSEPVDHAVGSWGFTVHFSKAGDPVLLEIQDAREFVLGAMVSLENNVEVTFPAGPAED